MSQMPPYPPPGYPPPPLNYPPGNYPPGNYPPGGPYGQSGYSLPGMTRTSAAAVTSLICGILMCIPGITSLVAIITGIVGISATKDPAVKGRGMAVAGLILGIIGLLGWGAVSNGLNTWWRNTANERAFSKSFITNLSTGQIDAAQQQSTANITPDKLQALADQMKPWGLLQNATIIAPPMINNTSLVTGVCFFANSQHQCQISIKQESGQLKVDMFQWVK